MPKNLRPRIVAAIPVVELPEKGSRIQSFSFVEGAVQKERGSPNYFKFTRELKSAKI